MKYSEASQGRVFIVRLEDGDILHESIEELAAKEGVRAAAVIILGGADTGSRLVTGPEEGRGRKIDPITYVLDGVYETAGTGTLFPGPGGKPVLHMHIAAGRGGSAAAGCVRPGVRVWHIMEAVIFELTGTSASRERDPETGFDLLVP